MEGNNVSNEWFPISKVSEEVNIPPETVRRYARQYRNYLEIKRGERNAYLLHRRSFDTITKIRSLLAQGHQHEQVKSQLELLGFTTVDMSESEGNDVQIINPSPLYKE